MTDDLTPQQMRGLAEQGYPTSPASTAGSEPVSPARRKRLLAALEEIRRFRRVEPVVCKEATGPAIEYLRSLKERFGR